MVQFPAVGQPVAVAVVHRKNDQNRLPGGRKRPVGSREGDRVAARLTHRRGPAEGAAALPVVAENSTGRQRADGQARNRAVGVAGLDDEPEMLAFDPGAVRDELQHRRPGQVGGVFKGDGVGPRRVGVEEVDEVMPGMRVRVLKFGEPGVFGLDALAVGAGHGPEQHAAGVRVGEPDIQEAGGRRGGQAVEPAIGLEVGRRAVVVHQAVGAFGFIHPVDVAISGQKIDHRIAAGQIHAHVAHQGVGFNAGHQGGELPAQLIGVRKRGVEGHKPAGKGAAHPPACHLGAAGGDVAEVGQQAGP